MSLRLTFNPSTAPINAKAGVPVPGISALDVDLTAAELDAAITLGLLAGPSRYASKICAGAANGRVLVRAAREGEGGKLYRVQFLNPGGTVGRSITVTGRDIVVSLAVTGGAINGTETATNIAAAINADAIAKQLVVASVAEADTGAGLVAVEPLTALGPAIALLGSDQRHAAAEYLSHAI
jgi:hypothetical protein